MSHLAHELWIRPQIYAIDVRSDLRHVCRVSIASWRRQFHKYGWTARDHKCSWPGADQDQPPTTLATLKGKLLSKPAAPRDAKHIYLLVAQLIKHLHYQTTQR